MLIPKEFIAQEVGPDKLAQSDFAFFLLLKSVFQNSVIYCDTSYKNIAEWTKLDRRTVSRFMVNIKRRGWVKPGKRGKHLILKSIEKDYEYKLKPNGKTDKKRNKKYFRVKINGKFTLKQIRNLVRGLLVKGLYQKELFKSLSKQDKERLTHKQIKFLNIQGSCFGYKKRFVENCTFVKLGVNFLGKMMGVSKSTASRVTKSLHEDKLIVKRTGFTRQRGLDYLLKVEKLPYGIFIHGGVVYKQELNSYAF